MKAVLWDSSGDGQLMNIERTEPDEGEVLIKVNRVQLSVTECQYSTGEAPMDRFESRLAGGPAQLFGHEFCGRIQEVPAGVDEFSEGDLVYAPGKISCGECSYCKSDYEKYCKNKETLGFQRPGALAEFVVSPIEPLEKVPAGVTDAEAAALQPLVSAIAYVNKADIEMGDIVAVIGTGVMGYQCAQIAKYQGAETVIGIDIDPEKLSIAENSGINPIDATEVDPITTVEEFTDGIGVDVVFEAVGGNQEHAVVGTDPLAQAFQLIRRGGKIVQVSNVIGEVTHDPKEMAKKFVTWINLVGSTISTGPNMNSGEYAGNLISENIISIDEYITHEVKGLENFEKAIEITMNKNEFRALGPCQIDLTG